MNRKRFELTIPHCLLQQSPTAKAGRAIVNPTGDDDDMVSVANNTSHNARHIHTHYIYIFSWRLLSSLS
jgi:predicted transcriptional regulator